MNRQEYLEIKNRAWNWYKNGMKSWILTTIKDFANAPQWVKDAVCYYQGNSKIDFDFVVDRDDVNLLKKYDTQIDTILRASQRLNFKVNYTKELLEFQEAERDGDEYEMIDAICDMMVVAINAGKGLSSPYTGVANISYEVALLAYDSDDMGIIELCSLLRYHGYNPYQCLLETIKELNTRTGAWNEAEGKWCKDLGAYTEQEAYEIAKEKGIFYNFGLEYDKKTKEAYWVSDTNDSADWKKLKIKKWYKADYSQCKLGEENV